MTGASITIIDDDEAVRHSLQALLEATGHAVAAHATGEEFLAAATPGGCLIIDLNLPGIDGIEVVDRLRRTGARTPVILISARFDAMARARAARAGTQALLEKPLRERALLDCIEQCLAAESAATCMPA